MKFRKLCVVVLMVAAMKCVAAETEKPRCDSKHAGLFWPEEANGNSAMMQAFVQTSELEVCSRTSEWRYRWSQVSVSLDQLKKKSKAYREHARSEEADRAKAAD